MIPTRIETLGDFPFDGRVWSVEVHAGAQIWVTHDGEAGAKMFIAGPDAHLGPLLPVGHAAPWDWLRELQTRVMAVVESAGRAGKGPWAPRYSDDSARC